MGKKTSSTVIPSSSSNPSAKPKKSTNISKQDHTKKESTSIDDIFAAPKKRKAEVVGPVIEDKKKGKSVKEDKSTSKSKVESSKSRVNEPTKKKSSIKEIQPPESSGDEDEEFDDEGDFEDFSDEFESESEEEEPKLKTRKVEEIIDPSSLAEIRKKIELQKAKTASLKNGLKKKSDKDREEDQMFADSRGVGPRRQTEEGFLIYKEAELQIDPTAGGTPLCPFDCECCF